MKKIPLRPAFSDERGTIIDVIDHETINAVTLITFTKGAVRGNHYHKETIQWNYLMSGKVLLRTRRNGQEAVDTIMAPGDLNSTGPEEHHALLALEDSEMMFFTKGPRGGKEYETDTFRMEVPLIDPNTPGI
jgi:quercetin dioxygenase-like cupin family protein